jgi:hypothetical protein
MKLLRSEKMEIPEIYLITDKSEIELLPIGVPFFYGDAEVEEHLIRLLEYEMLWKSAEMTGLPFKWELILEENGYSCENFGWQDTVKLNYTTEGVDPDDIDTFAEFDQPKLSQYIKDNSCVVNMERLKELNIMPTFGMDIEAAVRTNLQAYQYYNPYMYNKKLGGMYGGNELVSPPRNLFIIDISASIPTACSSAVLVYAKNLAEACYADLVITSEKTTFYPYEEIHKLNIDNLYKENGRGQESVMFRKLVTSHRRVYKTCICFGDFHSPLDSWGSGRTLSREDGQNQCQWEIQELISFHTTSNDDTAGYADMFRPKTVQIVKDWVKYLKD